MAAGDQSSQSELEAHTKAPKYTYASASARTHTRKPLILLSHIIHNIMILYGSIE